MLHKLKIVLEMIKFEHTLFALPFALIGMVLAADGWPSGRVFGWILVAMVGARSAAMGFNRLVDRQIDAANPRTASRALPAGLVSPGFVALFVLASLGLLVLAAWRLNPMCVKLVAVAIPVLLGYSFTKRFTWVSHLVLGLALGGAPLGAWIAVTGALAPTPFLITFVVLTWVAGFDVLYALQDEAFDRAHGLHSLPARLGAARAIGVARGLHVGAAVAFAAFAALQHGGWGLWTGVLAAAVLLVWQHSLIAPGRLERLDTAFFTANGALSLVMLALYVLDMMIAA